MVSKFASVPVTIAPQRSATENSGLQVRLGREALRIDAVQGSVLAEREDLRVQVTGMHGSAACLSVPCGAISSVCACTKTCTLGLFE